MASGKALARKLENYLKTYPTSANPLFPTETSTIRVWNMIKIGGGFWAEIFSFNLTYIEKGSNHSRALILKVFHENVDPILKSYVKDEDLRKCVREFQALRNVRGLNFPVPEAILYECNPTFLGYPFIVMEQKEFVGKDLNSEFIEKFAVALANLHNIPLTKLAMTALKRPENELAFARRWPIHFRHQLNLENRHKHNLKKDFMSAVNWLESNVSGSECLNYCLTHGDYHPGNVCFTKESKIIVLDWDSVEIGDPAYDVGYAYHFIKFFFNPKNPKFGETIAEQFIKKYAQHYLGDISRNLEFYKMVGILGTSISYSSGLSNPVFAYKYHKRKVLPTIPFVGGPLVLLSFPFLSNYYVARRLAADGDILWLKYFRDYLNETSLIEKDLTYN